MPGERRRILIIQGHPGSRRPPLRACARARVCHGCRRGGHQIDIIDVAKLNFPLLRSGKELRSDGIPEAIRQVQSAISAADHLVLIYPVWNGAMPALLKGFLEQTFRPRFIFGVAKGPTGFFSALRHKKALKGKTARIIVTMQMPAFVYRWYFRPHPEKNILRLSGIAPIRESLIGLVEGRNNVRRERWLGRMYALGVAGQ